MSMDTRQIHELLKQGHEQRVINEYAALEAELRMAKERLVRAALAWANRHHALNQHGCWLGDTDQAEMSAALDGCAVINQPEPKP